VTEPFLKTAARAEVSFKKKHRQQKITGSKSADSPVNSQMKVNPQLIGN
jgi:hypothetical protein